MPQVKRFSILTWCVWQRFIPLWLVLIALAFVPYQMFSRDLWTDEAFTVTYTALADLEALIDDVRKNEETPPLYFIAVWFWARVFEPSEAAIRSFSTLCGILAIGVFGVFARRWLTPVETFVGGSALALAPLLERLMLVARAYTLSILLALVCIIAFERLYHSPSSRRSAIFYGLSAAALFLTNYFGIALLAAHWVLWLRLVIKRRNEGRQLALTWLLAQMIVVVSFAPWLSSFYYQLNVAPAVLNPAHIDASIFLWLWLSLFMHAPPPSLWLLLWMMVALLLWLAIFLGAMRPIAETRGVILRTFVMPALMFVVVICVLHITTSRYLSTLLPGAALAIGAGWGHLRRRSMPIAILVAVIMISGMAFYRLPELFQPAPTHAWPGLVARVARNVDPQRDVVLFHPPWDRRTFEYYYHGPALTLLGAHSYDDFYYVQGYDFTQSWTQNEALAAIGGSQRVWVFHNPEFYGRAELNLPLPEIGGWRAGNMRLTLHTVPEWLVYGESDMQSLEETP